MHKLIPTLVSKNSKGFSLIEILISIVILSFITLAITSFTENSIDTSIKISAEDNEALQIETAMARVEWDVSQAYSPLYFDIAMNPQGLTEAEGQIYNQLADFYQGNPNFSIITFNGLPIPINQSPDKDSFVFFSSSNRRKVKNSKQSNYSWVKYELQNDKTPQNAETAPDAGNSASTPADGQNILVRKVSNSNVYGTQEIEWDKVKSQALLRKVISVVFEFWNPQTKKWVGKLTTIANGSNILHALKLTLKYYDPDNIETVSVRIFRPLFPFFQPEDVYKFLKGQTGLPGASGTTEDGTSDGSTTGNPSATTTLPTTSEGN